MPWYLWIPLAWFVLANVLGHGFVWYTRRGCERVPTTTPYGIVKVIYNDPLASKFYPGQRGCTTIVTTVGFSEALTDSEDGCRFDLFFHECCHAFRQWKVWGWSSVVLFFPVYLPLSIFGKANPLEAFCYREQRRVYALPRLDPEREAWELATTEANQKRPK